MHSLLIKGGRIIDPATQRDEIGDILIIDGHFANPPATPRGIAEGTRVIDASRRIVCPGLIDMHVHLREPGQSAKETIATGTLAAARGGIASVLAMPNTSPPVDSASVAAWVRERGEQKGHVNVFVAGAISVGLAGEELAPIGSLKAAGVVALTDDGRCVQNHELMRRAVEYARMFNLPVLDHCQDYNLVGDGIVNEGYWSTVLGISGWPAAGEELMVSRDILIASLCESPIHCQHLSCAGSVARVREARARGVPISAELCPHHIALTDETAKRFDTNYKMNPPLRTHEDIEALLEGVADGTIQVLCSDHAPHTLSEKEVEFDRAPFGIVGLETELSLFMKQLCHDQRVISIPRLIEMMTLEPARLLGINRGTLGIGCPGDVTIIDPDREWTVDPAEFASLGRNTPFGGWELKGRATHTIVGGKVVFEL